jgi:replicative DNA helicase
MRILNSVDNADGSEVDEIVNDAQAEVFAVTDGRNHHDYTKLADSLERTLQRVDEAGRTGDELRGVGTGFVELDKLTGGLRPSHMIVIAARPAMGKSTLGLDLARSAAIRQGITTVVFTLEMDVESVTSRLLAAEAGVPLTALDRGKLTRTQWEAIAKTASRLAAAPLFIDDTPQLTLATIRAKCRKLHQAHGLGLVIVDYLQLLGSTRRIDNRQVEVAEQSRGLKLLAKELGVPVVALSQLNRGVETRADKRPVLADMRESGAIEQDADLVIFVHREDAYDRDNRPGEADLIIAKHRQGPTGVVAVAFQSTYTRFTDMPNERI